MMKVKEWYLSFGYNKKAMLYLIEKPLYVLVLEEIEFHIHNLSVSWRGIHTLYDRFISNPFDDWEWSKETKVFGVEIDYEKALDILRITEPNHFELSRHNIDIDDAEDG